MSCFEKMRLLTIGFLLPLALFPTAHAGCSQAIEVPAAPAGRFVMTDEKTGEVSGVYPELLRSSSKETGCTFNFIIVPRARFNQMLEQGTSHLFIPESQTPEKDTFGEFIPLFYSTPVIISARPDLAIRTIADIKKHPALHVDVVRSYDWGSAYRQAVKELKDLGMVTEVTDAGIIARKMEAGRTDITIMSAHILYGNVISLGLTDSLGKRLRYIRSPDFEAIPSGVYLSNSLPKQDRRELKNMLQNWLETRQLWRALQANLPQDGLMSLTPLHKNHLPASSKSRAY